MTELWTRLVIAFMEGVNIALIVLSCFFTFQGGLDKGGAVFVLAVLLIMVKDEVNERLQNSGRSGRRI